MELKLAAFIICLGGMAFSCCGVYGNGADDVLEDGDLRETVSHSIDYVDNDPEFLVGVRGLEYPLCFNTEGKSGQVVRLLQDPETGIVVNARIFYDSLTNKTYISAVMIAQGNFRILGKQRVVIVNNTRYDWGKVKAENFGGNRVVIRENIVAVTFRKLRITLAIQRHFATLDDYIDYDALDSENPSRTTASNVVDGDGSSGATGGEDRADTMPVIGFHEQESLINHFLSSKRRRSLLLQKFFGINNDRAVVRNLIIELDTDGRKKRGSLITDDVNDGTIFAQQGSEYNSKESKLAQQNEQPNRGHYEESEEYLEPKQRHNQITKQQRRRIKHRFYGRRHVSDNQKREEEDEAVEGDIDKRRNRTVFLGIYIADSRDFSNKTHGLLGQFLFKNITQEKLRFSNGRMKARLLVHGNTNRRTIALLTLRRNMAMNSTRSCWKIRHQGRDVLDGKYSDYLVPALRYNSLKELPPPAPI